MVGIGWPGLIETGAWGNVRFPQSVALMKAMHEFQREWATNALPAFETPTNRVWAAVAVLPDDATPLENVAVQIREAGYWSVSTCSCRLPHWLADPGHHCGHMLETCVIMGKMGKWCVEHGMLCCLRPFFYANGHALPDPADSSPSPPAVKCAGVPVTTVRASLPFQMRSPRVCCARSSPAQEPH